MSNNKLDILDIVTLPPPGFQEDVIRMSRGSIAIEEKDGVCIHKLTDGQKEEISTRFTAIGQTVVGREDGSILIQGLRVHNRGHGYNSEAWQRHFRGHGQNL